MVKTAGAWGRLFVCVDTDNIISSLLMSKGEK